MSDTTNNLDVNVDMYTATAPNSKKEYDVLLTFTRPGDLPKDVPNTFIAEYLKSELVKKGNELISEQKKMDF
jgi:hypothetical protein